MNPPKPPDTLLVHVNPTKGPWDVRKAFFWLYRPFFGYIPPSIAKKGGIFLKRRWYVAKVVYNLIGIYDIPEPGGLGRASGQGPEA